jgi:hypothetical protein
MVLKITDTAMTSDITKHVAMAWPVPGEPDQWSVTWLPARRLTQNEAVTAMTIAETVAMNADHLNEPGSWRVHVSEWAAELGLAGPLAIAMAIKPGTTPGSPNHNRSGDACPDFCATDHDETLIPGKPQFGYVNGHKSDAMRSVAFGGAEVRLFQPGGTGRPRVLLEAGYGVTHLEFGTAEARQLAAVLRDPANDPASLAADLEAAADMITAISTRATK